MKETTQEATTRFHTRIFIPNQQSTRTRPLTREGSSGIGVVLSVFLHEHLALDLELESIRIAEPVHLPVLLQTELGLELVELLLCGVLQSFIILKYSNERSTDEGKK